MYNYLGGAFIWDTLLDVELLIRAYEHSEGLGDDDHSAFQKDQSSPPLLSACDAFDASFVFEPRHIGVIIHLSYIVFVYLLSYADECSNSWFGLGGGLDKCTSAVLAQEDGAADAAL